MRELLCFIESIGWLWVYCKTVGSWSWSWSLSWSWSWGVNEAEREERRSRVRICSLHCTVARFNCMGFSTGLCHSVCHTIADNHINQLATGVFDFASVAAAAAR